MVTKTPRMRDRKGRFIKGSSKRKTDDVAVAPRPEPAAYDPRSYDYRKVNSHYGRHPVDYAPLQPLGSSRSDTAWGFVVGIIVVAVIVCVLYYYN
jgi:hypothetical protein